MCYIEKEATHPIMAFPNFFGRNGENAGDFLDNLEMAFLVSGRDNEALKLRAFPLVLKEEASVWFHAPRSRPNTKS